MVLYEKVKKMKWVTHWEASDPGAGLGEAGDTVTIDNQAPYRVTCGLALSGRHVQRVSGPDPGSFINAVDLWHQGPLY
jgi:hypothetical protein